LGLYATLIVLEASPPNPFGKGDPFGLPTFVFATRFVSRFNEGSNLAATTGGKTAPLIVQRAKLVARQRQIPQLAASNDCHALRSGGPYAIA
jgi:hypothetical protein